MYLLDSKPNGYTNLAIPEVCRDNNNNIYTD